MRPAPRIPGQQQVGADEYPQRCSQCREVLQVFRQPVASQYQAEQPATSRAQRRMLAIEDRGRTTRSIGTMTVGPVTRVRVPNSSDSSQENPSSQ